MIEKFDSLDVSESGSESESVVADLNEKSESEENEDDVFLFDSNIPSVPSISHSESLPLTSHPLYFIYSCKHMTSQVRSGVILRSGRARGDSA